MLKKLALTGALSAVVTGSILAAPANAGIHTNGGGGVISGNQVVAPISVPIAVCGNAVAVLGIAGAGCQGSAAAANDFR
ncbi:chaplin family protein [Actinomadura gamaensis]|uniref:Chaplin family protein n=1 Tax=Actinomadura gamaensis TaxID=1763541 RepID=A0ABV9U8P1_9ACTN